MFYTLNIRLLKLIKTLQEGSFSTEIEQFFYIYTKVSVLESGQKLYKYPSSKAIGNYRYIYNTKRC